MLKNQFSHGDTKANFKFDYRLDIPLFFLIIFNGHKSYKRDFGVININEL